MQLVVPKSISPSEALLYRGRNRKTAWMFAGLHMVVTLTATEDGRKLTNFLQLMKTKEYNIFVSYFTSC